MKSLITVCIVGVVLALLENNTKKKGIKRGQKKFTIRTPRSYFIFGVVEAGMVGGILIWGELTNQLNIFYIIVLFLGALPGLLLMILPIAGVWEVQVDGDNIEAIKLFVFKKHFLFSEITHCKETRGGWKVYVNGRHKKAFFVDRMMEGANLFLKRIEKANIPIEEMKRDKD